jgi:hypothetical protein
MTFVLSTNLEHLEDHELNLIKSEIEAERAEMHPLLTKFAKRNKDGQWRFTRKHLLSSEQELWNNFVDLRKGVELIMAEQSRRKKIRRDTANKFDWAETFHRYAKDIIRQSEYDEIKLLVEMEKAKFSGSGEKF